MRWSLEELNSYLAKQGKPLVEASSIPKEPKYHNEQIVVDGEKRDSLAESNRYEELKLLQRIGKIKDLQFQVKFELLPKQDGEYRHERPVTYIADFVYYELQQDGSWKYIVEDTKGRKTTEYVIKRKLMLYLKGISIKET